MEGMGGKGSGGGGSGGGGGGTASVLPRPVRASERTLSSPARDAISLPLLVRSRRCCEPSAANPNEPLLGLCERSYRVSC